MPGGPTSHSSWAGLGLSLAACLTAGAAAMLSSQMQDTAQDGQLDPELPPPPDTAGLSLLPLPRQSPRSPGDQDRGQAGPGGDHQDGPALDGPGDQQGTLPTEESDPEEPAIAVKAEETSQSAAYMEQAGQDDSEAQESGQAGTETEPGGEQQAKPEDGAGGKAGQDGAHKTEPEPAATARTPAATARTQPLTPPDRAGPALLRRPPYLSPVRGESGSGTRLHTSPARQRTATSSPDRRPSTSAPDPASPFSGGGADLSFLERTPPPATTLTKKKKKRGGAPSQV